MMFEKSIKFREDFVKNIMNKHGVTKEIMTNYQYQDSPLQSGYEEDLYLLWIEDDLSIYPSRKEFNNILNNEYSDAIDKNIYFDYCTSALYKEHYNSRLNDFKTKYVDANESDFIQDELNRLTLENLYSHYVFRHAHFEFITKLKYSLKAVIDFLQSKNKEQNKKQSNIGNTTYPLKWNGTQTDFVELIKALLLNETLKHEGTQEDYIKNLANLFSIEIKNPNKLITDLKKRSNGSETKFLDALKSKLYDYIQN